jgi:hypothetical protein
LDAGFIKKLTGGSGGIMTGRTFREGSSFGFPIECACFLVVNQGEMPKIDISTNSAMLNRLLFVPFRSSFVKDGCFDPVNLKFPDSPITQRFSLWMSSLADLMIENFDITWLCPDGDIPNSMKEWREDTVSERLVNDSLSDWLDNHVVITQLDDIHNRASLSAIVELFKEQHYQQSNVSIDSIKDYIRLKQLVLLDDKKKQIWLDTPCEPGLFYGGRGHKKTKVVCGVKLLNEVGLWLRTNLIIQGGRTLTFTELKEKVTPKIDDKQLRNWLHYLFGKELSSESYQDLALMIDDSPNESITTIDPNKDIDLEGVPLYEEWVESNRRLN